MGEYADMAIEEGLDQSWGWRRPRQYSVNYITCRACGETGLLWSDFAPFHLTEWSGDKRVRHTCKSKGWGL